MEADIQRQIQLFTLSNSLPKIDIHAHLNGSIRKKTLLENLSISDKNELEKLLSKMDFPNAMKFFKISSKIITDLSIVRRITKEMLEDWKKHNVIYLEIRTPLYGKAELYTKEEYLKAVLEEINNFNNEKKMITRLIISLDREKELNDYEETYNIYKNLNDENLKKLMGIGDLGPIPKKEKKIILKIVLLNNYLLKNKEIFYINYLLKSNIIIN